MNKEEGAGVDPRLVGYALVALVFLGGCAPQHALWRDTETIIQPQEPRAETQEGHQGYLVIAMRPGQQPGDAEMERYPPVYLYDQNGNFLNQLPNNTEYPKVLRPGEYIVLIGEADPLGPFRQVQVDIEDGRTTTVSLADIDRAPGR
jgi:hypothetical protein